MFKIGTTYKHEYNTDVAFRVTGVQEQEDKIDLFGRWYNITSGLYIDDDFIHVKKEDIGKWSILPSTSS